MGKRSVFPLNCPDGRKRFARPAKMGTANGQQLLVDQEPPTPCVLRQDTLSTKPRDWIWSSAGWGWLAGWPLVVSEATETQAPANALSVRPPCVCSGGFVRVSDRSLRRRDPSDLARWPLAHRPDACLLALEQFITVARCGRTCPETAPEITASTQARRTHDCGACISA